MLSVLIPTSGLGSRLGELSDYTNKALVRVGTKAVISHIIDAYPPGTRFYVMLGHKGELVREYLSLAYPDHDIVYLDNELTCGKNLGFVGALRQQGDLIGCGPLIFHASDTIIDLPPCFLEDEDNQVLGAKIEGDVHDYRTIRVDDEFVQRIKEKGDRVGPNDLVHVGVVRFQDVADLLDILEDLDAFDCDTQIVTELMQRGAQFYVVPASGWYDTGNMSKLDAARAAFADPDFVLLEKTDQAVYMLEDRVIKFFADPLMVSLRIERARFLGEAIPKILGHTAHFFAYEKAGGRMARDAMPSWRMASFLDALNRGLWKKMPRPEGFTQQAERFYKDKTLSRLKLFHDKTGLIDGSTEINGQMMPSLERLLSLVDWAKVTQEASPCLGMHGDLHFSNVLLDGDRSVLLDWREGFGEMVEAGDAYYDLGKLLHGLIVSHDLVEQRHFSVTISGQPGNCTSVNFDILRHNRLVECEEVFQKWCAKNRWSWSHVRLVCALIFLNIAALHHDPYDKFLHFLGKSMLYEITIGRYAEQ